MAKIADLKFEITGADEFTVRMQQAVILAERLDKILDKLKTFEFELKIKQGE